MAAEDERAKDAELTGCAQQHHAGLRKQRTEIDHCAYPDKDQQGEEFCGDPGFIEHTHHPGRHSRAFVCCHPC